MRLLLLATAIILGLFLIGWIGLQIPPKPLPEFSQQSGEVETQTLPDGLPIPVENFYRQVYGNMVPVIESAVLTGRAKMRIKGITFPARFRFAHDAGQGYRHYMELTWFGFPIMKVNEYYLGGASRLELPFGVEEGAKIEQGANLALWGESMWYPSIFVTDERVRWEPIDEETALLTVPFERVEQRFVARFDPEKGMLDILESMRYKGGDSERKTLWLNKATQWEPVDGHIIPKVGAVTWFDEGSPWAVFTVEDLRYNVDVDEYIQAKGP